MSGANVTVCDVVRNLTTMEVGIVVGTTTSGRLLVAARVGETWQWKWERTNVEVIGKV